MLSRTAPCAVLEMKMFVHSRGVLCKSRKQLWNTNAWIICHTFIRCVSFVCPIAHMLKRNSKIVWEFHTRSCSNVDYVQNFHPWTPLPSLTKSLTWKPLILNKKNIWVHIRNLIQHSNQKKQKKNKKIPILSSLQHISTECWWCCHVN